jgi:hypothetical protein
MVVKNNRLFLDALLLESPTQPLGRPKKSQNGSRHLFCREPEAHCSTMEGIWKGCGSSLRPAAA